MSCQAIRPQTNRELKMSESLVTRHVSLSAKPDTNAIRVTQYNGRTHLVVPVVAMVGNSVVWPSTAQGPEFVPVEALEAVNPINWNNRPCVCSHPDTDNGSANSPEVLESSCFGQTFNAQIDDGKLKLDAYLDVERAKEIGGETQLVIDRLQANKMVEISIGALVSTRKESGEYNGQKYEHVWQAIVSDHLAFLREKEKGACSNEIGCGAPRLNSAKSNADSVLVLEDNKENVMSNTAGKQPWIKRFLSIFNPAAYAADNSVNDLRQELSDALNETVALFAWIIDIRYDSKQVIYSVYEDSEARWNGECLYYLRGYTIDAAGEVTLGDDAIQVEASMNWTPTASDNETVVTQSKSDTDTGANPISSISCSCHKGEKGATMTKKELIAQLISSPAAPFDATDETSLGSFDDAKLKALADKYTSPEASASTVAATGAETIASADLALLRTVGARLQREDAARRVILVSALKSAQTLHPEEELKTMETSRLEEMYQLLGLSQPNIHDYSGLGLPVAPSSTTTSTYKPVNNSFEVALAKERGQKTADN